MANQEKSRAELEREVLELRERLEVAEETLQAITQGEVDAFVVSGIEGEQIFTLQSADYPYRRFVEDMQEGAATVNSEGMILYCNNRLTAWLKYSSEKLIGSEFKQYIVHQDWSRFQTLFQQAQDVESGMSKGEFSLIATDGTEIPVQVSISSLTMSDVQISGLIVTDLSEQKRHKDIIATQTAQLIQVNTQLQQELRERQQVEEALHESEERLQLALEGSGDGFWDWNIATGEVYYSPRYIEMLGYEVDEFPTDVDNWKKLIHPDDQFRVMSILEAHFQDSSVPYSFDYRMLTKSGEWQWIADYGKVVVRDAQGKPLRMAGTHKDISDRKLAEKELELQAVITRNMPGGICLIRATDCVIVYANRKFEQIFGYEINELNGNSLSILHYEDDQIQASETTQQIIHETETHGEVTYEIHNVKKDGTPFWCRATTSKFDHPDYGTVYVAVQQDITENKKAGDLIKASLKEKEVLLKEIHHRVKNNLQIVTSLLQMQSRRTQEPQAVEILRDSKNRIASIALVHEKLYQSNDLAVIDFGQYIPDLTMHLFDTYNVSSDTISLHINVEDISVPIDIAIPCSLIVNELVSNSLKYAFPDNRSGEIQVDFKASSDDTLMLIVRDNGIGIPEEFDIETTHSLGLTLVQGLVEQLEGTLELVRNQGTEFKITFPGDKL